MAASLVLLVAGCGGGTTVVLPTTTVTTTTTDTTATSGTTDTTVDPPTKSPAAEPRLFQTPSGNIGCTISAEYVRCDILDRDWSPPPKPASCEYVWGHTVELRRGGNTFLCVNDSVIGADSGFPELAYGDAIRAGPFVCLSTERALKCASKTGRGFTLSREKVRLF